ncbi:MAG TPA: response regulator, partial [Blastocatellia bacterium]|nr:response regulator [Blastocatellia bacterium]
MNDELRISLPFIIHHSSFIISSNLWPLNSALRSAILSPMRILVVEDEAKMAAFIKRGLEEEGAVVDISPDGEDGLFRAKAATYDLVILDITLPLLDGIEVCRRLRQDRIATPVLLLTARDSVDMKVR